MRAPPHVLLAIDTSTDVGAVAVALDGHVVASIESRVRAKHGETLLPHVAHALGAAGVGPRSIDVVAVGLGPGSFTGLRIGVATAKGLALGANAALVGVSSLEVIALRALRPSEDGVVLVDAFKGEVYAAAYHRGEDGELAERIAPFHATPEHARARIAELFAERPVRLVGTARTKYGELFEDAQPRASSTWLDAAFDAPAASALVTLALRKLDRTGPDSLDTLEPAYVRGADITLPRAVSRENS